MRILGLMPFGKERAVIANSRRILAVLLFLPAIALSQAHCGISSNGTSYEYRGLATGRNWIIDVADKSIAFGGLASDYEPVDAAGLRGFWSQRLVFTVPEDLLDSKAASSWEYRGAEFRIARSYMLELFGEQLPILEIRSRQTIGDAVFLFSMERGLIAMVFELQGSFSDSFISVKGCGYGATGEESSKERSVRH